MSTPSLSVAEKRFFDAIIAAPDADEPRLVFADWLDDHDQPRRAELIRVQCEMAALSIGSPRWKTLRSRERAILSDHSVDWFGHLHGSLKRRHFRRGLIQSVNINAKVLVNNPDMIFRFGPINMIKVDGAANYMGGIADLPHLVYVAMLDLKSNRLTPKHIEQLAQSPHVTNLDWLDLAYNDVGNDGAQALANSPHFVRLASLRLENTQIGDDGFLALADSSHLHNLKYIFLSRLDRRYRGTKRLVERFGDGVHP